MAEEALGDDGVRYTAFLSYSHRDAAFAARLHRRLESYRIPRRLAGTETARGAVPARLWPIFRDREELPAASDLSETVRAALAQSGALIILCSPAAAGSLWVAEEIEVFRNLHPGRPILAAILDGDPPDCFPQALRAFGRDGTWHEPLATDLRPGRDGARLGLLKLVAGITGVGLDELVQRDAARRIRRVTAVTAVAVIAMLIMAALAVVAVRARAEAERQRAEAEGLIEFMLTDLRRELGRVGRLDVMSAVNERALSFYERQDIPGGTPVNSAMRARVLLAIGENRLAQGDTDGALALFREARLITAALIERSPDALHVILAHAQSEYWIGRVYELRRQWPAAQSQYARFATLTERMIAAAPADPDHMLQVAWSAIDLGNVQLSGLHDPVAARRSYERAVQWFGRAAQARPDDVRTRLAQANAYAWLADSYFAQSLWQESLEMRLRQLRIVEHVHRADPADVESGFRLALAQRAVARSYFKLEARDRARDSLFLAYDMSRELTAHDPRNAEWMLFRATVGCDLFFMGLGLPEHTSRAALRGEIEQVATTLSSQNNPRISEISPCLTALNRPETPSNGD